LNTGDSTSAHTANIVCQIKSQLIQITLGQALSTFFIVSYTVCIIGYLLFPDIPVKHESLAIFLPGFTLLSWHTFFLGLFESFIWGW